MAGRFRGRSRLTLEGCQTSRENALTRHLFIEWRRPCRIFSHVPVVSAIDWSASPFRCATATKSNAHIVKTPSIVGTEHTITISSVKWTTKETTFRQLSCDGTIVPDRGSTIASSLSLSGLSTIHRPLRDPILV